MRVWERIRLAYENDEPVDGNAHQKESRAALSSISWVSMRSCRGHRSRSVGYPTSTSCLAKRTISKSLSSTSVAVTSWSAAASSSNRSEAGKREKLMKELSEGSGAEGCGQEHHRLRRLHRPGRRGRAAPHHRHVLGTHSATRARWCNIGDEMEVKVLDIDWERRAASRWA